MALLSLKRKRAKNAKGQRDAGNKTRDRDHASQQARGAARTWTCSILSGEKRFQQCAQLHSVARPPRQRGCHVGGAEKITTMRHATPPPSTKLLFVCLRQIPYFIFIVNSPCCPSRISFTSVKNPNQTTGVISTPNAGGIEPLTNLKRGSVGQTATLNGNSFSSAEGYHDITMRQSFTYQRRKLRCYMSNVKSKYVVDIGTKIFLP